MTRRPRCRGGLLAAAAAASLLAPLHDGLAEPPGRAPAQATHRVSRPREADSLEIARALARGLANPARPALPAAGAWDRAARLYAASGERLLWLERDGRPSPRAAALGGALARADRHGLRPADYALPRVLRALGALSGAKRPSLEEIADADVLLTASFAAFGADVLTGRTDPRQVEPGWHIDARAVDVDSALAAVLRRGAPFHTALATLRPRQEGYDELMEALARYRALAAAGGWGTLPAGASLRPGDRDARVPALRRRLAAEGYLRPGAAVSHAPADTSAHEYDGELVDAVARFQSRHGLEVDGVLGPRTRAALDVSAERRARQIAANLERLRWLPSDFGERFLLVNVPAFRLYAYDRGAQALTMPVVVGSELEDRHTPVFSDSMQYVQFGPYWNVPRGIAVREILPEARRDRGYLARHGYEILRGWGDSAPVVSEWSLSDEALFSPGYRVRQRPGPRSALGRVKFIFPNDFAVYLHDTPAKALFAETRRAYSHGCVRVGDPAALAAFVLRDRPEWDAARIGATLATGQRVRVDLRRKLPVYLVYLTAYVRDGELAFRSDLYDMDARLLRALEAPTSLAVVPGAGGRAAGDDRRQVGR